MPADAAGLPDIESAKAALTPVLDRQRAAFRADPFPDRAIRAARLDALIRVVGAYEARIVEAVSADFGHRARMETLTAEVVVTIAAAKAAKRNLAKWMRPRGVPTPLTMAPGRSRVAPQPLGVVGVVAPWNYPVQLALSPAVAALAAGDRVMIKPSELTPRTADLLAEMAAEAFDDTVLAVTPGGVETGRAFVELPFDHLLFTGSTAVGRHVYMAAAKSLTPVTLELGGKSPAILDESADLQRAAPSIVHGKLYNAGQTCVAPDYVLTPAARLEETVAALTEAARGLYPQIDDTPDYTSIVSDRHYERLASLVEEAREAGARIVEVGSQNALKPQRKLPFTLIVDPPSEIGLMREEIFGPVLPVLGVAGREAAIERVNEGDRPLALYWFGEDAEARDDILTRTISGGVTVNDTLWHVAQENLPFGGVGASGIGAYHGRAGFDAFSHLKPVFLQSRFASSKSLYPPFSATTEKVLNVARKLM